MGRTNQGGRTGQEGRGIGRRQALALLGCGLALAAAPRAEAAGKTPAAKPHHPAKPAKPRAPAALEVRLGAVNMKGAALGLTLVFHNPTNRPVRLWRAFLPKDGLPGGDWFRLTAGGKPVAYHGRLVKRHAPRAADFVTVAPGGRVAGGLVIGKDYRLAKGQEVALQFAAINPGIGDQPAMELTSNPVRLTLR